MVFYNYQGWIPPVPYFRTFSARVFSFNGFLAYVIGSSAGFNPSPNSSHFFASFDIGEYKTALEPITFASKPLKEKTVAENVLKYVTHGINIDSCRIPFDMHHKNPATNPSISDTKKKNIQK